MLGNGEMIKGMAKALFQLMATLILVISKMIIRVVKAQLYIQMELNMLVYGMMVPRLVKASSRLLMEQLMLDMVRTI